ncbi:peptide deformylase [Ammonifex thiophilus]|uniref:Peptide deformylase n=1 Tax=Ammonifex thiophilus TaxID=444093 RepID=A0A3D8P3R1_9THEO|nr:peptide deformylase [Ammonifex thiophilus]RDV83451.1 peptide deformylase [Ammonifex thiophilus]
MAVRKIVTLGSLEEGVLREKARPVDKISPQIQKLIRDMTETMYRAQGVGLAAPQVGVSLRVIVVDTGSHLYQLINPVIVAREGEEKGREGCLSIPGVWGEVVRAASVLVRALTPEGKEVSIEADGLLARALQHEIDHLDGILFIDRAEKIYEGQ